MTQGSEPVPIRECDCCGERKRDVVADAAGAYQCAECLEDAEKEAVYDDC